MKRARAGKSAQKLSDYIVMDVLLAFFFLIVFAICYARILNDHEPWSFKLWFIFLPSILVVIAVLDLLILMLDLLISRFVDEQKEHIEYDKNSIRYCKNGEMEWEIPKDEIELIEYHNSFPFICSKIKIRCNEKVNYIKKYIILTSFTLKKLSKDCGYPVSKL